MARTFSGYLMTNHPKYRHTLPMCPIVKPTQLQFYDVVDAAAKWLHENNLGK
jgi:hypothetical protein